MRHRILVATLLAFAAPAGAQGTARISRPADLAGLYRFEPARTQRDAVLDMMTEFAFVRLERDGRLRMEAVRIDTRGGTVAPTVTVGAWSRELWSVRTPGSTGTATFCLPMPAGVERAVGTTTPAAEVPDPQCHPYERDPRTGDLAMRIGSGRMTLRRVMR